MSSSAITGRRREREEERGREGEMRRKREVRIKRDYFSYMIKLNDKKSLLV